MPEWRVSLGLCILLRPTAQRSAVHLISFVPALYSHGIRALCFGYAPDRCYMGYTTSRYDGPGPWHLQLQIWLWKWRCLPRGVQLEPLPWRQRVYTWVNLRRRWWGILPPALAVCFEKGVHTTNIHDLEYRAEYFHFGARTWNARNTNHLTSGMRFNYPPIRYRDFILGERLMAQGNRRIIIRCIIDNYTKESDFDFCEYGRPVPSRFGDPMVYARKRMQLYRWSSSCKQ